jgi:hypothetical protein
VQTGDDSLEGMREQIQESLEIDGVEVISVAAWQRAGENAESENPLAFTKALPQFDQPATI